MLKPKKKAENNYELHAHAVLKMKTHTVIIK